MTTFKIIVPVQYLFRIEAATERDAIEQVARFTAEHSVPDFHDSARDVFVLEPRPDEDQSDES